MTQEHHWVQIREDGRPLGAGFLVTQRYVLTAMHCLRNLSSEDARLELELPEGRVIPGRLCDSIKDGDLALIAVENAHTHNLPQPAETDWPRPNTQWLVTYRPTDESTGLSGSMKHDPINYPSLAGGEFTGFQLTVTEELGTYEGYSGSPVDTDPEQLVVGLLMEEQLSRKGDNNVTNVLYAASIRHAMSRFPKLSVNLQRQWICEPKPLSHGRNATTNASEISLAPVREADEVLKALKQWEEGGYITSAEAAEQRRWMLQKLGDRAMGGDSGGRG
ncbi:trypsin-like peptidase domain-containing protein [Streptomyces sp. NPDC046909]|uniref:trypsin-like peptidase domain-containing protein n=1 Tax=Streptomyces sp. NPDC046909 TaxID=3155617 RepID=UPI0034011415